MEKSFYYGDKSAWFTGIVEDVNDPLQAGRVRVRVYGLHSFDNSVLPTSDLPWAMISLPATESGVSGVGRSPTGITAGSKVHGKFLDPETKQQPLIEGVLARISRKTEAQRDTRPGDESPRLRGSSNAERAFAFFLSADYSEDQSAALVAVLTTKSGVNLDSTRTGGIVGWTGDRLSRQREHAASLGLEHTSLEAQLLFVQRELETDFVSTNRDLVNAQTTDDAVDVLTRSYISVSVPTAKTSAQQVKNSYGSSEGDKGSYTASTLTPVKKGSVISSEEQLLAYLQDCTRNINELIVHHTDTFEDMKTTVLDVDDWHKAGGFSEIGYHFLILRNGDLQVGRLISQQGEHSRGRNSSSIGIAFVGGRVGDSSAKPPSTERSASTFRGEQWKQFDTFLRVFLGAFPKSNVVGHNDTDPSRRTDPEFDVEAYVENRFAHDNEASTPTVTAPSTGVPSSPVSDSVVTSSPPSSEPELVDPSESESVVVVEQGGTTQIPSVPGVTIDLTPYLTIASAAALYLQNINNESFLNLSDVQNTTYSNGQGPVWNSTNSRFEPGGGSGFAFTDTTATSTTSDFIAFYDTNDSNARKKTTIANLISDNAIATATSTTAFTNKSGNISQWTNDSGYITSTLTQEQVEDFAGALVATGGTKTGIAITYDDVNGDMDFIVSLAPFSTSDLSEGSNLYYTTARANTDIDARVTKTFVDALNVDADTLDGIDSANLARTDIAETFTSDVHLSAGQLTIGHTSPTTDYAIDIQNSGFSRIRAETTGASTILIDAVSAHTATDQSLSAIRSFWGANQVTQIRSSSGDDTTNKDDGYITFHTAESGTLTEQMRIEQNGDVSMQSDLHVTSGQVAIGHTSPTSGYQIDVQDATRVQARYETNNVNATLIDYISNPTAADAVLTALRFYWGANQVAQVRATAGDDNTNDDDGYLTFHTAEGGTLTEQMRIEQDGNISMQNNLYLPSGGMTIGHSTLTSGYHLDINNTDSRVRIESSGDSTTRMDFYSNRTATDTAIGNFVFYWDGTNIARIRASAGDDTTNKDDGYLTFATAEGGTLSERMRIEQDGVISMPAGGQLAIGHATPQSGHLLDIYNASAGPTASINTENFTNFFDFRANRTATDNTIGIMRWYWDGTQVAQIRGSAGADTTNKDDGYLAFYTAEGGTNTERMRIEQDGGVVVGSPTGSSNGAGTINAQAVYDDNSLLSCYVFDQYIDDSLDIQKWDDRVPDRVIVHKEQDDDGEIVSTEKEIIVRKHNDARKFMSRMGTEYDPLTLDGYAKHWKEKRHLTSMPNEDKYDIEKGMASGSWIQRMVESLEIQAILIEQLNQKVKRLEVR